MAAKTFAISQLHRRLYSQKLLSHRQHLDTIGLRYMYKPANEKTASGTSAETGGTRPRNNLQLHLR